MAFIKTNKAESVEPVKKDDEEVVKIAAAKSLLDKVRGTLKGR